MQVGSLCPLRHPLVCGHPFAWVLRLVPSVATGRAPGCTTLAGLTKGLQLYDPCSAQVLSPTLPPPADMLKDVIREYDEHFPEIIERATYTLEKVGAGWE